MKAAPPSKLVSYVIVSQAKSPKLLSLLGDLVNQLREPEDAEVVVAVNGNPTYGVLDGTPYLSPGVSPIRVDRTEQVGACHTRCWSASLCQGKYIWFLDDDTRLTDNFIEITRAHLRKDLGDFGGGRLFLHPALKLPEWADTEAIFPWVSVDDPNGQFTPTYPPYNASANGYLLRDDLISMSAAIRNAPYELGRKGKSLLSGEEIDMWYRLYQMKRRHLNVREAVVFHDIHLDRLTEEWFVQRAAFESFTFWCRIRNYGLAAFLKELVLKTPGIIVSALRYGWARATGKLTLERIMHFRERTAFLPYFFKLLTARPLFSEEEAARITG